MPRFVDEWTKAWRARAFRDQFLLSVAGLIVALVLLRAFLDYVETRHGVILYDPLLLLFSPVDFKWITVSLIYSGMLLGLISLCLHPFGLLLASRAFVAMILLRIVCLFFLPLDPPADIVPLIDPLIQWPNTQHILTRDLFFAGYPATMALLAFTEQWKDMKIIFFCAGTAISVLLFLQHAHYTIDVVAAPCFAYVAYGIAKRFTVVDVSGATGK